MFGSTGGATIYGNRDADDTTKRKMASRVSKINPKTHIYPVTLSPLRKMIRIETIKVS